MNNKKKEGFNDTFDYIYNMDKCCIINKELDKNGFYYSYNISDKCSSRFDNTSRCIKENENVDNIPFSLKDCTDEKKLFGSCRRIGFECIDFMTEQDCDKYVNMIWSEKTCQDKLNIPLEVLPYEITQI